MSQGTVGHERASHTTSRSPWPCCVRMHAFQSSTCGLTMLFKRYNVAYILCHQPPQSLLHPIDDCCEIRLHDARAGRAKGHNWFAGATEVCVQVQSCFQSESQGEWSTQQRPAASPEVAVGLMLGRADESYTSQSWTSQRLVDEGAGGNAVEAEVDSRQVTGCSLHQASRRCIP